MKRLHTTPAGRRVRRWIHTLTLGRSAAVCLLPVQLATAAAHAEDQPPRVNLNTASSEQLQYLPRVGPAMADIIISARAEGWKCIGDPLTLDGAGDHLLTEIYRVGEATAEKLVAAGAVCEGETTATAPTASSGAGRKYGQPKEG